MTSISKNSTITISYIGKLDNGHVFKTVTDESPHTFTIGNHEMPPTLEDALLGLTTGDTKKIRLSPEEGYGARQKILLHTISRESFGDKLAPKPGMILSLKVERDGKDVQVPATVMEVNNETVVVDYNHPLAGHHLTYQVKILSVDNG